MKIEYIGKCLLIEEKEKRALIIGDLHLGYEEVLNKMGVFVSRQMYDEMISDLEDVFERVGKVDFIVLLGDVKHEFSRNLRQEWNDVLNLLDYFNSKLNEGGRTIVTRGNHDNYLKTIASKREDVSVEDYFIFGKVCFVHGDKEFEVMKDEKISHWVMGHVHPAVKISDGMKTEKFKCFFSGKYDGKDIIIVPSFIEFKEGSDPRDSVVDIPWKFDWERFRVKIVGEKLKVLDFGNLKDLS